MGDDRRMTTDRFFGGVDNRLENLQATFGYIAKANPTQSDLWAWLKSNTGAESDSTIQAYVGFLRSIGLLERDEGQFSLTSRGQDYRTTSDRELLFETLVEHVKGFETILQSVSLGHRTDDAIQTQLQEHYPDYQLPVGVIVRHLEWLEVVGAIEQHGDHHVLTAFGQDVVDEYKEGEWVSDTATQTIERSAESEQDGADLSSLRERAERSASTSVSTSVNVREVTEYDRSDDVRAYVLERADGECEGCGEPAPFVNRDGDPYLHAHHVLELSAGGPDSPETVIALCPNCHYRVHHGRDGEAYNRELVYRLSSIEDVPGDEIVSVE